MNSNNSGGQQQQQQHPPPPPNMQMPPQHNGLTMLGAPPPPNAIMPPGAMMPGQAPMDATGFHGLGGRQQPQPAWKALSDFALQSEIEKPPFQQLVS